MPDNEQPLRLAVMKALTAALETVKREAPSTYTYDMAGAVFRGRSEFGESDPMPMLSILETPVPAELFLSPENSGLSAGNWDLLIQGFIDNDHNNPTDPAHFLMADVMRVIANESKRRGPTPDRRNILGMGPVIASLEAHAGTVRPADEYSAVANFWLRISIKIAEDISNPFV